MGRGKGWGEGARERERERERGGGGGNALDLDLGLHKQTTNLLKFTCHSTTANEETEAITRLYPATQCRIL